MAAYAFNDYLVSGADGLVNLTVTMTRSGTATGNYANGFANTQVNMRVGTRNPNSVPDPLKFDAVIPVLGGVVQMLANRPENGQTPSFSNVVSSAQFSVVANTPFEFGYLLSVNLGNADVSLDYRIALSAPAGYSVASITPVPEPETWAMLLAGLGLLGAAARRNQKKIGR